MNANELADKLSQFGEGAVFANVKLTDVATMLRQQQAEIEALKSELDRAVELYTDKAIENETLKKELYFKDYYEELPDTPVDLLRKAQEK